MKRVLNVPLKTAIFQTGKLQRRIATLARMNEYQLSHIVRGRREATPEQRARLAQVLGRPEHELFPCTESESEAVAS
jgi:transcriptional regulator with XRE-family HTH domain